MIFIEADEPVNAALKKLLQHDIDGMPILEGDAYLGLVTLNAIYEAAFNTELDKETFLTSIKVRDIAINQAETTDEDETFEDALVKVKNIPLLAVVNDNNICRGIVTRYDILQQFQSAFGMNKKGVRISFKSVESRGRIARLSEITKQFSQNIISLATFDETDKLVRRIVMKIDQPANIDKFIKRLEKNGFVVLSIKEDE